MSKQSEAKINQNYRKEYNSCGNCQNYTFERTETKSKYTEQVIVDIKNKRCELGGFSVNVSAVCDKWEGK